MIIAYIGNRENVLNILYLHTRTHTFHEIYFSFQDETKDSKKEDKKKIVFISPYMRYKRVIPIVMDQEAKEREKGQNKEEKEKEGEDPIVKIQDEYVNESEINESKNRVHEHFKQMSQINKRVEIPSQKKKRSKQLILNQIHGGKRKKEFDVENENRKKNDNNDSFMMSTPYLDAKAVHVSKKAKKEAQKAIQKGKMQESFTQVRSNNSETVKSIR